jgi:hypothetical protein
MEGGFDRDPVFEFAGARSVNVNGKFFEACNRLTAGGDDSGAVDSDLVLHE